MTGVLHIDWSVTKICTHPVNAYKTGTAGTLPRIQTTPLSVLHNF